MRIAPQIILQAAVLLNLALTAFSYPDLVTAKPAPEPALPAGFDTYAPPVTAANPPAAAPVFAEWTRTGAPTDTMVMTGQRFSTFTGLDQGKDTSFIVYGQTTPTNQKLLPGAIRRLDGSKAAIGLDSGLPPDSMYLIWAGNQNGFSAPIPVNKTDAWWIGPERTTRGTTVSVFGRSLSRSVSSNLSSVYVKRPGNFAGVWATVTAVNPYKVDFVVPSALANGAYEVWVHNGCGGHYGWSGPLTLTLDSGPGWTGQEFNVKSFGATGNGSTDDFNAITDALNNLAVLPGSTLYFPAGVYQISDFLEIPSNVRLRGEGRTTTTIRLKVTDPVNPPAAVIYAVGDTIEILDLTLTAAGTLPTDPNKFVFILASAAGAEDLRFTNLRISGAGSNTFDMDGPRRLVFKGCEITGRNGYLLEATQVFIEGCSFFQTNDAQVPVWAFGGKDISMTGCNTRDLDNSNPAKGDGWGLGRWFVGSGIYGTQRHVYLGDNTSTDLGVRAGPDQNTGEQFLWELNNFYFSGPVTTATATSATLNGYTGNIDNFVPGQNDNNFDTEVIVIDGTGVGQHRAISAVNPAAGSITIIEPWSVIPDSSSKVVIMTASEKVAIYRNYLDGKPYIYQQEPHVAAAGVQPFEGALDFVVDGNTFHEIRTALSLWGYSDKHQNKPLYFGSYINNLIENNRWGVKWVTQSPSTGINFLGNVFRGNTLRGILFDGFTIITDLGGTNPKPWVDLNVIERTNATNLPLGITRTEAPGATLNTLILRNSFSRGLATLAGSKGVTFLGNEFPSLRENTWTGFENTYAGTLPGPILESPYRIISVDGLVNGAAKAASLDIWDAGTAPLTWTAASNAPWLKLTNNTGTVAGESAANTLAFTCDPQGLTIGAYTGYITITASSQTKIIKVLFGVGTAPNTAPTISDLVNKTINEDAAGGTGATSFTVGDAETAAGSLTVAGSSSNTTLVPNANIVFGGSGASRTVTVTPAANQSGTATITVTVSDGTLSKSDTFLLTVNAVNDPPTISDIANRTINEDTGTGAISFTVGDVDTAAANLTVTRGSSNQTLVPDANIVLGGSGASRTVTVTPAANQSGTATITVTVSDGQLSTSDTFLLTVNAVKDPPTISDIANRTVNEDTGTGAIPFTVGDAETPAASLTLARGSSNQILVPDANIVLGGSGASRTVLVTPAANQSGTATITVTVSDGAASASDTFLLTVNAVNDPPTISDLANRTVNEDTGTGAISFTVGDVETPAASLTLTRSSSNQTLVPDGNIVLGGSGTSRAVSVTPAANQSGTATITVTVSDGQLSTSDTFLLTVNAVNDPPTISNIADRTVPGNSGTGAIPFTVGDLETPAASLTVTRASSNQALVPDANVVLGGSGASRTVTVTPAANQFGTATITVTVSDGAASASDTFLLTVTSNAAPTISDIANKTINEDGTTGAISFTVGDAETAPGSLTLTRSSSNTTLVPAANIVFGGSGASRSVTVTPAANQSGTATLTVTVSDGSLSKSDTFVLTVTAVNDAPSFTKGPNQMAGRSAGVQTIAAWATNLQPGPADETGQTVNFLVENDNAALFATPPAIASDGTLTFTPATKVSGKATVTVRLRDNGGTANGGGDTSAPQVFTIAVTSISDVAGQYNGLVQAPGGQAAENPRAGRIRVSLLTTGAFTGQLIVGGKVFPLTGASDQAGVAHFGMAGAKGPTSLALHRLEQPDLLLTFNVDVTSGTDTLTGKLTENGTDFATLEADRDVYTAKVDPAPPLQNVPASLLGRYTVIFGAKAQPGASSIPRGYGYGTIVVAPSGIATLAGMLPDGRAVTYANAISKHHEWPFYVALYIGTGSVWGPLTFHDAAAPSAVDGPSLIWFKPVTTGWYPAAFSGQVTVTGSHYVAPPVRPQILNLPAGSASFTVAGGNVTTDPATKHLTIDSRNRVKILGSERFMMTLLPAPVPAAIPPPPPTGVFSGTFYDTEKKARPFKGVVLQKQNVGFGLVKGNGATGSVELKPDVGP
ncbi:MAG: hypothetical protein QOE70_6515 [Chthoniobacter sp.]|jgi:hypothetical protein|nr:hypothetical protein [Chthoniobacter sp.]